jgi:hypothetical protein
MTVPKSRYPIESFGPEIMAALLKASREKVTIAFQSYRDAVRFQQRIHILRSQMRDLHHPMYPIAARVHTSVLFGRRAGLAEVETYRNTKGMHYPRDRNIPAVIILKPRDSEFTAALNAAGVQVTPLANLLPETPTPQQSATTTTESTRVDSILDDYGLGGDEHRCRAENEKKP